MAEWSIALPLTARCLSPLRVCPDGQVVFSIVTDCSLPLNTEGLPWWPSGLRHCHWLLAVSHHWGPTLMAEWSIALSLTAHCLSTLKVCLDGQVVYSIATDCSLPLNTEGMPWWPSGLMRCHWLLPVIHQLRDLPWWLSGVRHFNWLARCLSLLRICPDHDGQVVYSIATDCSLPLTTEGLLWWPSGL